MTINSMWKVHARNLGAASKWLNQSTNVNDDASVTDLVTTTPNTLAGYEFAVQNAASYHEPLSTNPTTINVTFGPGELDGFAFPQGNAAQSATSRLITDYNPVYSRLHPTSAVQMLAFPTLLALDPTPAGTQFGIATAEANAFGLPGDGPSAGGSVGLNSSLSWAWASPNFLASDAAGILEHAISWNHYFSSDGITVSLPFETPVDVVAGADAVDRTAPSVLADSFSDGNRSGDYLVDPTADFVTEGEGAGTDVVRAAAASITLGTNVEYLAFVGSGGFIGTGNNVANVITGGVGGDSLNSEMGADTLVGLAGADSMAGGAGNDTYVVDNAGDAVTEAVGAGTDLVQTMLSTHTLGLNVENLTFIGTDNFAGIGNALTDGSGADTLNGGTGDNFCFFSAGFGQDIITDFDANPAGGRDWLDISGLGITAAAFASSVTRAGACGDSTLVTSGGNLINLAGVNVRASMPPTSVSLPET